MEDRRTAGDMVASALADFALAEPDTMLIVDDDPVNRLVLGNIFSDVYRIEEAADGREGLKSIFASPGSISAILLDYRMPHVDGLGLLEQVAAAGLLAQVPVFLISAEADGEVMRRAYELGVMDVIEKPVVPFVVRRRVLSVVELYAARRRLSGVVRDQQEELLRRAAKIIELNRSMIEALAAAIEFRDGESGEHVRRIHDITHTMLAHTELGRDLTSEQIDDISLAAIMHDVGKIAIPDAILSKPGKLTDEEYGVMKTHTLQGERLLGMIPAVADIPAFTYARDIARHHHERWDGRGYPDGLAGDEISIWAQVVSLADVYDALLSPRCYKEPFSRERALAMIHEGACGTFNPALLAAFDHVEPELHRLYA